MPPQGRLGDKASVPADAHGCPACPHPGIGPAVCGSEDTLVNSLPALRVDDTGIHAACCNLNTWTAKQGSATVFINNKAAHRMGDQTKHCGGTGQLIEGSPNVIVGGASTGGGGGGAGGGSSSGSSGGSTSSGSGSSAGTNSNQTGTGGGAGTSNGTAGAGGGSTAGGTAADEERSVEPDEIEVRLRTVTGAPIQRSVKYELTLPSGEKRTGYTDQNGVFKITGLEERGECTLVLPDVDAAEKRKG